MTSLKKKIVATITVLGILFTGCSNTTDIGNYDNSVDIEDCDKYCIEHNIINLSTNNNIPESFLGKVRNPKDAQEKVVEAFNNLPDHIEDFYMDENGTIIIIDDKSNNITWAGLYKPAVDEIKIKKNAYDIESVLYHEIGHMIDYKYETFKILSYTREFEDIFEEEKSNFIVDHSDPEYFRNNIKEYFAQAYSEYLIKPRRLKKHCPKTYEFIKQHIDGQYVEVEAM
jgi:hypothetical protein